MSASVKDEKGAEEQQEAMKVPTRSDSGDHEALAHHSTFLDDGGANLAPEHREYLLKRHGTLSLDPLPSADPADPYNWPSWKVRMSRAVFTFLTLTDSFLEKHQSSARRIPRHDDYVHRCWNHPSVRGHRHGPRLLPPTRILFDFDANRCPRLCASLLETHLLSIWTSSRLAHFHTWRWSVQYRMRRQS